jgi:hypothetical protein
MQCTSQVNKKNTHSAHLVSRTKRGAGTQAVRKAQAVAAMMKEKETSAGDNLTAETRATGVPHRDELLGDLGPRWKGEATHLQRNGGAQVRLQGGRPWWGVRPP